MKKRYIFMAVDDEIWLLDLKYGGDPVCLNDYHGFSYKAICQRLGIPCVYSGRVYSVVRKNLILRRRWRIEEDANRPSLEESAALAEEATENNPYRQSPEKIAEHKRKMERIRLYLEEMGEKSPGEE